MRTKNEYEVSVSNDYYYFNKKQGAMLWASDRDKFETGGKTIGKYPTYEEAKKVFNEIDLTCHRKPEKDVPCSAFIYDKISGEVASRVAVEEVKVDFDWETHEDVKFTKEKMGEFFR